MNNPASETPGPGEGDLRGEVERLRMQNVRQAITVHQRQESWDAIRRERDAAVEQRTLAEQKVARVEALCEWWERTSAAVYGGYELAAQDHARQVRAVLADPEATT